MCTLVILRQPEGKWPLIMAANRDELSSRPWKPPARHWPDRPDVVAGLDETARGSWLGINDEGVVAAILNRPGTLGPAEGKRSRGELVLEALDHAEAKVAAEALVDLDPTSYRPFNMMIADRYDAFWLRHAGSRASLRVRTESGTWREIDPVSMPNAHDMGGDHLAGWLEPQSASVICTPISPGLSILTAHDLNDPMSPLISHYLPHFQAAAPPDPGQNDWASWIALLSDKRPPDGDPRSAMTVTGAGDFTTVCSQLVALPAIGEAVMQFAAGRPGEAPFEPIDLG